MTDVPHTPFEEAIKYFDKAIELDPNHCLIYNFKGISLLSLEKYEEAIKCFDKAKELIDKLEDSVDIFKVGLEQYVATRGKTVDYLKEKGKKIFLISDVFNSSFIRY